MLVLNADINNTLIAVVSGKSSPHLASFHPYAHFFLWS